jgi:transposase
MQAPTCYLGIDISKDCLDTCRRANGREQRRRFPNTPAGHRALVDWLGNRPVRACVEASGRYGLDIALALFEADSVDVMVANPRAVKNFREASMRRSKTDALDAEVLCDYAQRMPFEPWEPPEEATRELRVITRRIQALTVERAREKNRLHAHQTSRTASAVVTNDIEVNLRHLTRRIDELLRQTAKVIDESEELQAAFDHLRSIPGIARKSATLLLGELATLPNDMSVRQWVAYAGLDPKRHKSGTSVEQRERISKVGNARIRRALYMPALVAVRCDRHIGAFYENLLTRGKKPIVATVAVMRKLLHSIYGMLKHGQDFHGDKFYRILENVPVAA